MKIIQAFFLCSVTYSFGHKLNERNFQEVLNSLNSKEHENNDNRVSATITEKGKNEIMNTLDRYIRYKLLGRKDYDSRGKLNKVLVKRIVPHRNSNPDIQFDFDHNIIYKPLATIHKRIPVDEFKGFENEDSFKDAKGSLFDLIVEATKKREPVDGYSTYGNGLDIQKYKGNRNTSGLEKRFKVAKPIGLKGKKHNIQYQKQQTASRNKMNIRQTEKDAKFKSNQQKRYDNADKRIKSSQYVLIKPSMVQKTKSMEKQKSYNKLWKILQRMGNERELNGQKEEPKQWHPEYKFWNYWTYDKTIHQDDCPGETVRLGNICIDLVHH